MSSIQLGPKRKRPRSLQTKLKHSKEDRLIQSSKVSIRRVGKQVRTFLTLKIIQKIKTLRTAIENDTGDPDENEKCKDARKKRNDKRHRQITNAEGKLKLTKEFDIEILVDRCLEDLKFNDHINSESEETKNKVSDDASKEDVVLHSFLMHKKIASVVQSIKEKKSDFEARKHYNTSERAKKERNNQHEHKRKRLEEYGASSGLFIGSLSGGQSMMDEDEVVGHAYDPYDDLHEKPKKNRPGQRARRAKAMALEARRQGKEYKSINWRPKKATQDGDEDSRKASGLDDHKPINAADVADMGKNWKDSGKAHPSWAAKEHAKKQTGIATFAGKKITFD